MNSSDFLSLLFDASGKSAIVLLLAISLHWLLPKAAAATKHLWLALAICACLSLPLLTLALPTWRIHLLSAAPALLVKAPRHGTPSLINVSYTPQSEAFSFDEPVRITSSATTANNFGKFDWPLIAFVCWAIGAWVVLAQMIVGIVLVWLLKYQAQPLDDQSWQALLAEAASSLRLTRKVALVLSKDAVMPMTTGIIRPIVILPTEAVQWSRAQLKTVLLHELAHIKRYDCLTQLLASLACTLYWFNPLAWIAARQLRTARELACDDEVLLAGTRASDYASCLVGVAQAADHAKYNSPLAVGMACSQLETRIAAILNPARNRRLVTWRFAVMIILLIASLIVPLASFQPFTQAATPTQTQKEKSRETRSAEQKAEAEAQQQAIEQHQQAIEQHLRELETYRRDLTESQRQQLEQHLRETELLRGKAISAVEQQRLAAEMDRAHTESKITAGERAEYEVQIKALEEQLRAGQAGIEAQQRRALEEALKLDLSAQRENAAQSEVMLRLKRAEMEAELTHLRNQYTDSHPAMLEKRAQLEALNRAVEDFVRSQSNSNVEASLLLRQAELAARLQTMLRGYTEKHPDVQALKAQIEALRKEIDQIRK